MNDLMLAAVFERPGHLALKEVPIPRVQRDDDVLLKVEACGICGSDIGFIDSAVEGIGTPGTVIGHEMVGEVVATGSGVKRLTQGDRVALEPCIPCLECDYCLIGAPTQCENLTLTGYMRDGGFARYTIAPARLLHKIGPNTPATVAALAEPLTCVLGGMEKIDVQPGDRVVILGCGPIGALYVQMAKAVGAAKVIVSEPSPLRRDLAVQVGADVALDPNTEDLREVVVRETGIGADIAIDAVGNLLGTGLGVVRKKGTVLVFGLHPGTVTLVPSEFAMTEKRIIGTYIQSCLFPRAIRVLEEGIIDTDRIISHILPLSQIQEGMELLRRQEAHKIIIDPSI